jgi:hypothetical protein
VSLDNKLKLKAQTADDLMVISACLQDAVVTLGDMAYLPRERRFALMANRFLWEKHSEDGENCHRIRTGIHFEDVLNVTTLNISQDDKTLALDLLAVEAIPAEETRATILLIFAGGGLIRLEVECITCLLTDMGDPWSARCRPRHPVAQEED